MDRDCSDKAAAKAAQAMKDSNYDATSEALHACLNGEGVWEAMDTYAKRGQNFVERVGDLAAKNNGGLELEIKYELSSITGLFMESFTLKPKPPAPEK